MQSKLDKFQDVNYRRVVDLSKLKQSLERLKCDLQVLFLSKKLNKQDEELNFHHDDSGAQEASTDSEKLIGEQIQGTLEFISKIEQSIKEDIQLFGSDDPFSPTKHESHHERKKSYNIDIKSKT